MTILHSRNTTVVYKSVSCSKTALGPWWSVKKSFTHLPTKPSYKHTVPQPGLRPWPSPSPVMVDPPSKSLLYQNTWPHRIWIIVTTLYLQTKALPHIPLAAFGKEVPVPIIWLIIHCSKSQCWVQFNPHVRPHNVKQDKRCTCAN